MIKKGMKFPTHLNIGLKISLKLLILIFF